MKDFEYFDKNDLAEEWLDRVIENIALTAFKNQEEWIYMDGELGEGRNPMIKDNFVECFNWYFDEQLDYMRTIILCGFLKRYYEDNIDVPQWLAEEYNEWNGYVEGDKRYMIGIPSPREETKGQVREKFWSICYNYKKMTSPT